MQVALKKWNVNHVTVPKSAGIDAGSAKRHLPLVFVKYLKIRNLFYFYILLTA